MAKSKPKKKPRPRKPDPMEQVRGAAMVIGDHAKDEDKLYAFLSIFHSGMSHAEKRKLTQKE